MKTPDYMSYTKYKKKKNNNSQKALVIFITTFFVTLLFLTVIAKQLSPNVDVTIGDDSDVEPKESGLGVKRFIDDRLKMIQMEDNSAGASKKVEDKKTAGFNDESFDSFSKELDEKVNLPNKQKSTSQDNKKNNASAGTPPRPNGMNESSTPAENPRVSKVLVGYYASVEQAKVAQGILLDSGLNITPFIKDLGGAYTLQIGSYSSKAKADSLASELLKNNFPARVIQE